MLKQTILSCIPVYSSKTGALLFVFERFPIKAAVLLYTHVDRRRYKIDVTNKTWPSSKSAISTPDR